MRKIFSFIWVALMLAGLQAPAQEFIRKESSDTLTFKDMQRQFAEWKRDKDLSQIRYWKYFKRLEMEMQLHTDAQGEPADPAIYFREAEKVIREKQSAKNNRFTNAWYPVGPNVVPGNQTGYMENGIGRINCIAFHPTNPSTYFVGVAQGGVWKTTNNGQTWIPLTDNLPITRISDIAID
ncbi:MAG TPA: hypothetical protein VK927_07890, partial [Adhaeribacter sp.]|nr:hypothetical protein [Adhaeribacter sp.]